MKFVWVWLLILTFNLISALLLSRLRLLRQLVDSVALPRPKTPIDRESVKKTAWPRTYRPSAWVAYGKAKGKIYYYSLLISDDNNYSGFVPPRVTRLLISSVITVQNLIAIFHAARGNNSTYNISIRTGQLIIINMFPFLLSVAPDTVLVHLLRHSQQQVLWVHVFYGWLIWYEIVLHVAISLFATSRLSE